MLNYDIKVSSLTLYELVRAMRYPTLIALKTEFETKGGAARWHVQRIQALMAVLLNPRLLRLQEKLESQIIQYQQ